MVRRGELAEQRMKKWFKGQDIIDDAVDFQTKTTFYEAKSCNIFNKSTHTLQRVTTQQQGRYYIDIKNHKELMNLAKSAEKKARYVFCVIVGNQMPFLTMSWEAVNYLLRKKDCLDKDYAYIKLYEIFGGDLDA